VGARAVLDEMLGRGVRPTTVTFNTLVGAACREGHLDTAERLAGEMARQGVAPNVVTYALLMRGLCDVGRYDDSKKLMFDMEYQARGGELRRADDHMRGRWRVPFGIAELRLCCFVQCSSTATATHTCMTHARSTRCCLGSRRPAMPRRWTSSTMTPCCATLCRTSCRIT
jgi:pentatricopeptide repeat protein